MVAQLEQKVVNGAHYVNKEEFLYSKVYVVHKLKIGKILRFTCSNLGS